MTDPSPEVTAPLDPLALLRAPDTRLPLFMPYAFTMQPVPLDDPRWARLTAKFPANEVELKPQPIKRDPDGNEPRFKCDQAHKFEASMDGTLCGGFHAKSVHLKYVGHAGITMRLNDVVGPAGWSWLPMATNDDGTPKFSDGGMWIYLAILGHVKHGFGDPGTNRGTNATKETIGDAIRNVALRYGIGTELWSKSDRANSKVQVEHPEEREEPQGQTYGRGQQQRPAARQQQRPAPQQQRPPARQEPPDRPPVARETGWDTPTPPEPTEAVTGPVVDAPARDEPVGPPMPERPTSGQQAPPLRVAQARAWSAATLLYPTWEPATKQRVIEEALAAHMTRQHKSPADATADDWHAIAESMEKEERALREEAEK